MRNMNCKDFLETEEFVLERAATVLYNKYINILGKISSIVYRKPLAINRQWQQSPPQH